MRERVDTLSPKWRLRVESCRRARKQSGVKKTGPASWIRTPMPRNKPGSRKKVRALFLQQPLCVCVRGRGKHRDVASPHTRVFRHHHERTNPVATNITPQSLAHKHAIPTPLVPPPPSTSTARKWQQLNSKRYGTSRKFGYVEPPKEEMPPEVRQERTIIFPAPIDRCDCGVIVEATLHVSKIPNEHLESESSSPVHYWYLTEPHAYPAIP